MEREILTKAFEDYLKVIYDLSRHTGRVGTNQIAARLNISPPSVTTMLQRMAANNPPLVDYRKHQGAALTPYGELAALEVIRHHRLLESYLVARLGYSWDTVHEEACRLEHVISEDFEQRIDSLLGHPQRDPHGEPIPTVELAMPQEALQPLSSLQPPQTAKVVRVSAHNPALLKYLKELGLVPGAVVQVLAVSPFDGNLTLLVRQAGQAPLVLGHPVTTEIFVEITQNESALVE
ncbi:MAG: metal-dependent transcriptional regulator [Chloroflexota bacterium]